MYLDTLLTPMYLKSHTKWSHAVTDELMEAHLMLMANSPPSFCRTRKVPSDRDMRRFLAAVRSMFPANLKEQWQDLCLICGNSYVEVLFSVSNLQREFRKWQCYEVTTGLVKWHKSSFWGYSPVEASQVRGWPLRMSEIAERWLYVKSVVKW